MEQGHDCAVSMYVRQRQNLHLKFEALLIFVQGYVLNITGYMQFATDCS